MVIKKIHQIWVGPNPLPTKSVEFIRNIKQLHPDYEYRLWTDIDITPANFTNIQYINSTKIYAQKADIMRYEILNKHGGVYLDVDFQILKCLTPLLTHDLVVCNEDKNVDKYITNAFIYSVPGILKGCVDNIKTCNLDTPKVNVVTGPWYLRKNISLEAARVLPPIVMYPTHYKQRGYIPPSFSEETYGMHHWDKKW